MRTAALLPLGRGTAVSPSSPSRSLQSRPRNARTLFSLTAPGHWGLRNNPDLFSFGCRTEFSGQAALSANSEGFVRLQRHPGRWLQVQGAGESLAGGRTLAPGCGCRGGPGASSSLCLHNPRRLSAHLSTLSLKTPQPRDFPGSPVVRTPSFQCKGHGFDPRSGN